VEIADYQKRNISKQLTVKYNCLVKYRGASSTKFDKKSLAFKLVNKDGSKFEANILNLRKDDGWILDAMAIDRIRMRNRVCFDLWNELNRLPYETDYNGRSGTVGMFVEVFINGEYIGLYCLTDRINRDLLGLKKPDTTDGQVNIKGVMYQGINWKESWNLLSYKDKPMDTLIRNAFELEYPTEYPSEQAWRPLVNLIDFCSDSTSRDTFQLNTKISVGPSAPPMTPVTVPEFSAPLSTPAAITADKTLEKKPASAQAHRFAASARISRKTMTRFIRSPLFSC
ncbi:MAG: CotH kinase family protein, partial [Clostridia bacterium]|nr:CotH kinase family protein [Clostridia bacterium]